MSDRYGVVLTTINAPTRAVIEIAQSAPSLDADFILIGDSKSPTDFHQEGATYLDLAQQAATGFRYAQIAPARHYARKNVGYLVAIRNGATIIIETDDDNIPREDFWAPRQRHVEARLVEEQDWVNIYAYFADGLWPRGLPLDRIKTVPPLLGGVTPQLVDCPIQQGLADENPDVDAIYRLILPLPVDFRRAEPVALRGAWCPFNSQNTTWWGDAFPLLYLPYYCSFRMTDIWRSFVAQRIAYLNDWGVLFHNATVFQERNEHNLLRDFEEEVPGYLNNGAIRTALDALDLPKGIDAIPAAIRLCYERLIGMGLVGEGELALLEAWFADLQSL